MPLQDLTPQLRTRLSRLERTVGLFVALAVILLAAGLIYYLYATAKRKGWFVTKVNYFTFVDTAAGLRVGDPVKMMGFDVGEISVILPQPPEDIYFNVYIEFWVKAPNYGYLWTQGSRARVTPADFLGNRYLEVTKGTNGHATYREEIESWIFGIKRRVITGVWDDKEGEYKPYTPDSKYWLLSDEYPALTDRMQTLLDQVETNALPGLLALTNQLAAVLGNSAEATSNLNTILLSAQPVVTNLTLITTSLADPKGSLGEWLLPTNLNRQLTLTLSNAHRALGQADESLVLLTSNLNRSLENLANLTSNLNAQVQTNDQIVSQISQAIVHADELMQGLKRHWLFRSAFKKPKEAEPTRPPQRRPRAGTREGHR